MHLDHTKGEKLQLNTHPLFNSPQALRLGLGLVPRFFLPR